MKLPIHYCFFILLLELTGCSLGPAYQTPDVNIPIHWSQQGTTSPSKSQDDKWWRNFHDPILNELIEEKSTYNLNLKTAEARVDSARAEFAIATSQFFPRANLEALPPNGTGVNLTQVIALMTSLELDLFGRLRQTREHAKTNLEAELANRNFTLLNLYAEIASTYLEFREAQAKNKILHENLNHNQQVLILLKSQYKAGQSSYINIAQQDALLETQRSEIEQNKAMIIALLHKIELLTGNNPGRLAQKLLPPKPVPEITQKINLNAPSALLRRRPDIIAAERRVAASHADIRVAIANLFPKITIGWLLGWQTETLNSALFNLHNPDYNNYNYAIYQSTRGAGFS